MRPGGVLAVLNDLDAACDRAEYEAWYQDDHMPDRLAVPGFRHARRYRRADGPGQEYFTFYETDSPAVLRTPAYVARLAAPTDATVRLMRHFRAMCRSICAVAHDAGGGIGGLVAVLGNPTAPPALPFTPAPGGAVTRIRLWRAVEDLAVNPEASLRPGSDTGLAALLVVEGTHAEAVRNATAAAAAALGLPGQPSLYTLIYASPQAHSA